MNGPRFKLPAFKTVSDDESIGGGGGELEVAVILHIIAQINLQLRGEHLPDIDFILRQPQFHERNLVAGIDGSRGEDDGFLHGQFERLAGQALAIHVGGHGRDDKFAVALRGDGKGDGDR
ncbi:MAG: hypothetical protein ABSD57_11585 [Verrucomicrobiota bacterium]